MGIPSPLSFPPTALRNVAAGLVVGNPVGSGGTRAKALTAAELKAIVEASGISYLPLSGGTLTGALSLGSNGLTCGQVLAGTGFGTNAPYRAGSQVSYGTVGTQDAYIQAYGTGNYIYFGTLSGGTTPIYFGLTSGSESLTLGSGMTLLRGGSGILAQRNGLNAQCYELFETYTSSTNYGALRLKATSSGHQIGSAVGTSGSNRAVQLGHFDSAGTFTSGLSVATNGAITASGQITQVPPSSITLATNGQFSIEMTSNTAGNLVYRGSDGTTRRMALAFS